MTDNVEKITFLVLSLVAATSLILHFELIGMPLTSYDQLAKGQEGLLSHSAKYNLAISKLTSTGPLQEDSNFTSMNPGLGAGNRSNILAKLIADLVEDNLKQAASLLLITSLDPRLETTHHVSDISERYVGISRDLDIDKRDVAKQILSLDENFGSVLLPNGDIYLGEPFSGQIQLPRSNFADRDWYKGIVALVNNIRTENDPPYLSARNSGSSTSHYGVTLPPYYISEVFLSAAIHLPATGIAVPVYNNSASSTAGLNKDNERGPNSSSISNFLYPIDTLSGYWVGVLNMNETRKNINRLDLTSQNLRGVVVDHNGTAIIDTQQSKEPQRETSTLRVHPTLQTMLIDLQSVNRALNGEIGTLVENVNGTRTIISYHPIEAFPHRWASILMELDQNKS